MTSHALFASFFEAVSTDLDAPIQRVQWFLPSPGMSEFGAQIPVQLNGCGRFIKRRLDKPGHRAKWRLSRSPKRDGFEQITERLLEQLLQYESMGWNIRMPVVIKLEADDYQKIWSSPADFTTPYKALRHVEAQTKKRGYSLTS